MAKQEHPSVEEVVRNQKRGTKEMKRVFGSTVTQLAVGILLVVGMPFCAVTHLRSLSKQRDRQEYLAWVKLTGRTDITVEEFVCLKDARIISHPYKKP